MRIIIVSLCLLSQTIALAQQNFNQTIISGGFTRSFRVYVPAIYNGQTPRPLVFNFHGSGGTMAGYEGYTRFRQVADTANFILITPQGAILNPPNYSGWNNYPGLVNPPDDVRFTADMIDTLQKRFNIDSTRIYAAGWSNGGLMCYHLAWQLGRRMAAVGSVCGTMQDSMFYQLHPTNPIPVMEIHGTKDDLVPYNGGLNGGLYLMPVDSVLHFWVRYNGCDTTPVVTNLPNTNPFDGSTVQRYHWPNNTNGTDVELLKITNGGHTWPNWAVTAANTNRDITADVELWRFFRRHSLQKSVGVEEQQATVALLFALAPNPAADYVALSFADAGIKPLSADIFDLSGQLRLHQTLRAQDACCPVRIPTDALPPGIYVVKVVAADGKVGVQRLVVGG